jgi:hypothetical protein
LQRLGAHTDGARGSRRSARRDMAAPREALRSTGKPRATRLGEEAPAWCCRHVSSGATPKAYARMYTSDTRRRIIGCSGPSCCCCRCATPTVRVFSSPFCAVR